MTTIRVAFALLVVSPFTMIDARPSAAEVYPPWCAETTPSGALNCGFSSYAQCMMTAGPGTGAICVQNPWYLWYGPNGSGASARRR